ncbi:hypothetical protein [Microbacterium sp. 22242]|uniref:hypothetical protein n=1 Tax=Microbacterium sp. 22242 TaxID=3453896 RepID=UPI003F840D2D
MGEDFMLLSSAHFRPQEHEIEVSQRIGVDLILPVAAMLPFQRHVRWAEAKQLPPKVAENLLDGAEALAGVLGGALVLAKGRLPQPFAAVAGILGAALGKEVVHHAVGMARAKVDEIKAEALEKHEYLTAVLAKFRTDLQDAEHEGILLQSLR